MFALLFAHGVDRATAQACPGDCNGDSAVTVEELVIGVNIALGLAAVGDCSTFDSNSDGMVTVEEIIAAVDRALVGCALLPTPTATPGGSLLRIDGVCLRPGAAGLTGCATGTLVRAWRCDNRSTCATSIPARTLVGSGASQAGGSFSFFADGSQVQNELMILDAEVEEAVVYRVMDFGPAGGAGGALFGGSPQPSVLDVRLDPPTEAAIRFLDGAGLQNFTDTGVLGVIDAVRQANAATVFAQLDALDAVILAIDVAADDPKVQAALQQGMLATPTPTPQPVLVPSITTQRGCGFNAVYNTNDEVPIRLRVNATLGGVPLQTVLASVRLNNGVIFPEQEIAANTDFFSGFGASQVGPGTYQLTLLTRAIGSQSIVTATCQIRIEAAPPECQTACDCQPGQRCTGGQCGFSGNLLYCCTSPTCLEGAQCQEPGGAFGFCPIL